MPQDPFAAYVVQPDPEDDPFAAYAVEPAKPPASTIGSRMASSLGQVADVGIGAVKGAAQTATNLGRLVHKVPGVSRAVDAVYGQPGLSQASFQAANQALAPTSTEQRIGKGAEQVGEAVLASGPMTAAAKGLGMAGRIGAEAAFGAGLSAAQGGNPVVGGVLGGAGGAVGSLISRAGPALQESAGKNVMKALGPTKERFKAIAEKRTAEILKRGLGGSREALKEETEGMLGQAGQAIDDAIQSYGARPVATQPLVDALETAKDAFQTGVTRPDGTVAKVVFEARPVRQLEGLQKVLAELGPDVRADQLVAIRRTWDKVVADAGGFAHRAGGAIGVPLKDQSEAAVKKTATSAIRAALDAEVPELSVLNKEFAFWKDLDDVLGATMKRTQPHGQGLGSMLAQGAGGTIGAVAGSGAGPGGAIGGAVALGTTFKLLQQTFRSPRWQLATARQKDALAQAIMNNRAGDIVTATSRILASQASKIGQTPETP